MSTPDPTGHADVARVGEDASVNDGASTPAERAAEAALAVPGVAVCAAVDRSPRVTVAIRHEKG